MPDFSVLIEWENVLQSSDDRAARMLRELGRQIGASLRTFEVLVLFNPEQIDPTMVASAVRDHFAPGAHLDNATVRVVSVPGLHYYDLRNRGAEMAAGRAIVCLDSDVIPEPGWLAAITEPLLENPDINVLGGETHLDHEGSFIRKAFALGWTFPPRTDDDTLRADARQFWANNVAFRRSFFLANPYPTGGDSAECRTACYKLRRDLVRRGEPIYHAGRARVSHPAPDGAGKVVLHALIEGRDNGLLFEQRGYGRVRRSLRAIDFAFGRVRRTWRQALRHRRGVGVAAWQVPGVVAVMGAYYGVGMLGTWSQAWLPRRAWEKWRF
jgi:hypothetical protein